MPDIKLIALDLDGTLLTSNKQLSPTDAAALQRAADNGIHIVPTTGRFYGAMPEVIRNLPYVRYVISINGAQVTDLQTGAVLYRAEIPTARAISIMEMLDTYPVIYDCYMDNAAFMTASQKELIDSFAPDEHYRKMLHELRQPVPELKAYLSGKAHGVQKIQFFAQDMVLHRELLKSLPRRLPDIAVSTSVTNNIELNDLRAHKGAAVQVLASYLGIAIADTMACGDGLNDLSMIRTAGVGVAMENACPEIKATADYVTLSCDCGGVAHAIEKFCF